MDVDLSKISTIWPRGLYGFLYFIHEFWMVLRYSFCVYAFCDDAAVTDKSLEIVQRNECICGKCCRLVFCYQNELIVKRRTFIRGNRRSVDTSEKRTREHIWKPSVEEAFDMIFVNGPTKNSVSFHDATHFYEAEHIWWMYVFNTVNFTIFRHKSLRVLSNQCSGGHSVGPEIHICVYYMVTHTYTTHMRDINHPIHSNQMLVVHTCGHFIWMVFAI